MFHMLSHLATSLVWKSWGWERSVASGESSNSLILNSQLWFPCGLQCERCTGTQFLYLGNRMCKFPNPMTQVAFPWMFLKLFAFFQWGKSYSISISYRNVPCCSLPTGNLSRCSFDVPREWKEMKTLHIFECPHTVFWVWEDWGLARFSWSFRLMRNAFP
jgi:hypothetical protein